MPISPIDLGTTYDHQPAANTAAVVTLAAPGADMPGRYWIIGGIAWSYDDDPTGGNLSITNGGTTCFSVDITVGGPGFIPLVARGDPNAALVITLAAGGGTVSGKVNVLGARIIHA